MLTVCIRFRPESLSEHQNINDEDEKKISCQDDIESTAIEVFEEPKNYIRINNQFNLYFDHVIGFKSFQDDIFSKTIRIKVNDFLNGKNCCILTYGAKSSGKTYTMFGKLGNKKAVSHLGILPRTISYIIEKCNCYHNKSNQNAMDWQLFISFGNIYNNTITDLIDIENTKNIHLKKNKKTNEFYLKNLTQMKIKKISSFLKNLHLAYNNRKLYLSNHNNIDDRCHLFVIVKLNLYTFDTETKNKNKISSTILNFIDCASYPEINYKPFSETDRNDYNNLNFSFIQLNALMTRMAKGNDLSIDMRESLLTKLLFPIRQKRINNNFNNNLLIMINCTLNQKLRAETIATLRFGNLCKIDPFILSMMEKQRHRIKKLESKNKELKYKMKQQKKELNNNKNNKQELIEKKNEYFLYENKFEKLQSEYELLKLDFLSIKKELNTQKNHNFYLMEDYNELKQKNICKNINSNDQITNLLKQLKDLRQEKRENKLLLQAADNKLLQYENDINNLQNELQNNNNKNNEIIISESDPKYEIRKLKMEIMEYKNGNNNSIIVNKLRNKKHKLEEKVINLRTEKAKQLVIFNQERNKTEQQIKELELNLSNMKCISKWKTLIHKRRISNISKDIQRANKKMKENYKSNSEFRDQMYLLRRIAENKFDLALKHKMNKNKKINGLYNSTPSPSIKSNNNMDYNYNYEQLVIDTTADFEKEMIGLLPNNLKRIHEVIDQLTNKLMIQNGKLHAIRNKYDILNKKYIELQCDNCSNNCDNDSSTSSSKKN